MIIAGVIALCLVILILAFLAPRLSQKPQRGSQKVIGLGGRGASKAPGLPRKPQRGAQKGGGLGGRGRSKAPGPLGRWCSRPGWPSKKAVSKSGAAGRKGRGKMPF